MVLPGFSPYCVDLPLGAYLDFRLPCTSVSCCSLDFSLFLPNVLHLLLLLQNLLHSEAGLACQAICMSEASIRALTAAVERLTIATDRLADQLQTRIFEVPPAPPRNPGVIVEAARVPFPEHFVNQIALLRFRGPEEGPGVVPAFVIDSCKEKLSSKPPGPEERACVAYRAGFWASVSISTNTAYNQVQVPGLRVNHWVVLRSCDSLPFRTTTRRDFDNLVDPADRLLVFAVLDSLAEVEAFCLGASVEIPPLKRC